MRKLILFTLLLVAVVFGSNFTTIERSIIVVIDAGHGGKDEGMKAEGVMEKELTLAIAKKIEQLGADKGVVVILTRNTDEFISLQDRINIQKADLFISLHINANPKNKNQSGIGCFVSEQNVAPEKSIAFSAFLLNELKSLSGMKVNGIKTGGFYVLKNNPAPSVMLELGFLTNPSDYNFLKEESNQGLIAAKIVDSIAQLSK